MLDERGRPSGTVTFLFTDIADSTQLWASQADEMRSALQRHDEILRSVFATWSGYVFSTGGDGFAVAFARPEHGVAAALDAQRSLAAHAWRRSVEIRVRMGLHTGVADERDGDYYGMAPSEAARIMAVTTPGHIVMSRTTVQLCGPRLPSDSAPVPLGARRLRGLPMPIHLYGLDHPGADGPMLRSDLGALAGHLPNHRSTFVARKEETERVVGSLANDRLVTLTGPGGVGKTRLAVESARLVAPNYQDGAWFVDLSKTDDLQQVGAALLQSLELSDVQNMTPEASVLHHLADRRILIVLDNCEHLLPALATLVGKISDTCGQATLLNTSREPLHLPGERVLRLEPLDVGSDGETDAAALELFRERVRNHQPDFEITAHNVDAVRHLCRRLDGLPLALEMAASRMTAMSPQELDDRLSEHIEQLSLRGVGDRHATLESTFRWSFDRLTADEQACLTQLCVFAGDVSLATAEAVVCLDQSPSAGSVLPALIGLVDQSIVTKQRGHGHTRYGVPFIVRELMAGRTDVTGEPAARRRHGEFFAIEAERLAERIRGADEGVARDELVAEIEDIRVATMRSRDDGDAELAVRLVRPFAPVIYSLPTTVTALPWLVLDIGEFSAHDAFADIVAMACRDLYVRGEVPRLFEKLAETHRILEERGQEAGSLLLRVESGARVMKGDLAGAIDCLERGAAAACAAGDIYEEVASKSSASYFRWVDGDLPGAESSGRQTLPAARVLGNPTLLCHTLTAIAVPLSYEDPSAAEPMLEEAVVLGSSVRAQQALVLAELGLARVRSALDQHDHALVLLRDCMMRQLAVRDHVRLIAALDHLVLTLVSMDAGDEAAFVLGALRAFAPAWPFTQQAKIEKAETDETLLRRLGRTRFEDQLDRGSKLPPDAVIPTAIELAEAQIDETHAALAR